MTETEKIFKKNLITLREKNALTRYRIAADLKINKTYYNNLEDFEKSQSPTYRMLEKLAKFYNMEVYKLFMNEDNEIVSEHNTELAETVLKWWNEHQYDTNIQNGDEYNLYEEMPEFVKMAKNILKKINN